GGGLMVPMAVEAMPENKRPSACIGCQSCEAVCPQNIGISKMMTDFSEIVKL
ncbi:MAG: 4Fe-4S binding protein, partial [Clostridia bacterium]|nr:4Fe-4S binding protein [Clostridia bacterium]